MPTSQDPRRVIGCKTFPCGTKLLLVLVSGGGQINGIVRRHAFLTRLGPRPNQSKFVHKSSIGHDRVDGNARKILLLGPELSKKVIVPGMKSTEEEHDLEDGGDGDQQLGKGGHMALEARAELVKPLLVTLSCVEESQKGSEGVRDG